LAGGFLSEGGRKGGDGASTPATSRKGKPISKSKVPGDSGKQASWGIIREGGGGHPRKKGLTK